MKDIYYIGELVKALKINKETIRHMKKITSQRCDGYFVSGKEVGSADSELSKGSADAA
jgi:hypothetical protein